MLTPIQASSSSGLRDFSPHKITKDDNQEHNSQISDYSQNMGSPQSHSKKINKNRRQTSSSKKSMTTDSNKSPDPKKKESKSKTGGGGGGIFSFLKCLGCQGNKVDDDLSRGANVMNKENIDFKGVI